MDDQLIYILTNIGIGGAVIFFMRQVIGYLKQRDADLAKTEQTQTSTYDRIINNQAGLINEMRASSERRETEYQRHNQTMASALARLDETQVSQISVLEDIHKANAEISAAAVLTNEGVAETKANVMEVRAAVDRVLQQLDASIQTFTSALSNHDDNAKERNELLLASITSSNDLMETFQESMVRMEATMQQLRDLVKPPVIVADEQIDSSGGGPVKNGVGASETVNQAAE
ncbi:hypothetical protein G4Y79_20935 [Phototrophicus methaneseepsis]|uniref:Uncharacterized protein n=1 Tax=Phototrophicus methaneseepsis TaxID=2710758 RepID=A0A7S8IES6_9CHLR|nr:hypothetical protein [Phototrophicus methaneseepsis]QPC82123.1 hypothetical protein G4Y79_20935 [Phototrophicus methaneseepsis]